MTATMKGRFPESAEQKAERLSGAIRRLRLSSAGLESAAPTLPSLGALEQRIAAQLKTAAPTQLALAEATAGKIAQEGWTIARELIEGEISHIDLNLQMMANLEAVIRVTGRPAWFIKDDAPQTDEAGPEKAADAFWIAHIVAAQTTLLDVCARVGCIMLGDADPLKPVATGWLIGKDTIVTNAHVGGRIARQNPALINNDRRRGWRLRGDRPSTVDFAFEHGSEKRSRFAIEEVLYVEDADHPDIAAFRLNVPTGGPQPPSAMALDLQPRTQCAQTLVFAVGHPINDLSDDQNVVTVFGELDGTKRVSPGYTLDLIANEVLTHDCSTTNGNSGSPLIDFGTLQAVGLHYFGKPGTRNEAVSLAAIANHPVIVNSRSGN